MPIIDKSHFQDGHVNPRRRNENRDSHDFHKLLSLILIRFSFFFKCLQNGFRRAYK